MFSNSGIKANDRCLSFCLFSSVRQITDSDYPLDVFKPFFLKILLTSTTIQDNGKFLQTQKRLTEQGGIALASLLNTMKSAYIVPEQQCDMFDSLVSSILNYASEVWGFHHASEIELVHNKFCTFLLKVPKTYPYLLYYWGSWPFTIVHCKKAKVIEVLD